MNRTDLQWTQKTVDHPGVGPVRLVRSARARHLRLTIRPEGTVQLTLPRRAALEQARRFLDSRTGWIQKHLAKIREQQAQIREMPKLSKAEFIEAQHRLIRRLRELAEAHHCRVGRITIRCQKTKWGSCSGTGNINLNVNLIFLPPHLQDYVLVHELTHLEHPNHGQRFWNELGRRLGTDAKQLQKELRGHPMQLV